LAWIVGQVEHPAVARSELADLVADADADRSAEALGHRKHGQLVTGYRHPQRGGTELHREREPVEPVEEGRSEVQYAVADVAANVVALQQVQSPRHDTHVDAFFGRPTLAVLDVAVQRADEPVP